MHATSCAKRKTEARTFVSTVRRTENETADLTSDSKHNEKLSPNQGGCCDGRPPVWTPLLCDEEANYSTHPNARATHSGTNLTLAIRLKRHQNLR